MTFPCRSTLRIITAVLSISLSIGGNAQTGQLSADETRALEIYRKLISFRTASGHGKVPEMVDYLAGELKHAGFTDKDIHILPHKETAALVVRYAGDGSSGRKPILFLAHMDVVDAAAEDWKRDPFQLHDDGEYFLGRGTDDNKYGVMNLTQSFIRLKKEGFVPTRDLVLAFSGDEETGQETTELLAHDYSNLTDAEFGLNADAGGGSLSETGAPLAYSIQSAEKTYATFEITVRNPGGHSARPRKDNAIYELAEALLKIRAHRFPAMSNSIIRASLRADGEKLGGELGKALVAFADDPEDQAAIDIILQNEDYDHVISTTCVSTMLRGGQVENALPQTATATVNCRIFPGIAVDEIHQTLVNIVANDQIEIVPLDDYLASPVSEPREDVTAAVARAVHQRYPGLKMVPAMSSGYTDAAVFRRAGIPVYGVASGFIKPAGTNAHGINEHFPKESFFAGLDHWIIIIKELAGPK
jgi:acetylornithine deacetylase/succinyl-diaminopimelate desuccinylase-like protein